MLKFELQAEKNGNLIDILLENIATTSGSILSALKNKDISVNGSKIKENIEIKKLDNLVIFLPNDKIKYSIIYEDDNILIVDKGDNIEVCDGNNNLLYFLEKKYKKLFAVHRLDRNTRGLVVFAKNLQSKNELDRAFKNSLVDKFYYAKVNGEISPAHRVMIAYLVKDKENSLVKIYDKEVKGSVPIKTEYSLVKCSNKFSIVDIKLHTGKTHQIRAHFAHIGHSLVGDGKYGDFNVNKKLRQTKQNLYAYKLKFNFDKTSKLFYLNSKTFEVKSSNIFFFNI